MTLLIEMKNFSNTIDLFMEEKIYERTSNLFDSCYHYIEAGGKRLRPFIIYQCYKLITNEPNPMEKILPIASAMEILHSFTLIHDDIMDNDKTRRGVEAVHKKWGTAKAILAGDALFGIVPYLVSTSNFDDAIKNKINTEISIAAINVCEGQSRDIEFEKRTNVTIEEYIQMISLKTSTLFEKGCLIGGLAANASNDQLEALQTFGKNLGIAFQIIDDILGLTAMEEELGKPVGSDIERGKKTYLVINTLNQLDENEKYEFLSILTKENISKKDLDDAISYIVNTSSLEKAEKLAQELKTKAIEAMNIFPDSDAKKNLLEISDLLIHRKN